jgi:hypothetical protein
MSCGVSSSRFIVGSTSQLVGVAQVGDRVDDHIRLNGVARQVVELRAAGEHAPISKAAMPPCRIEESVGRTVAGPSGDVHRWQRSRYGPVIRMVFIRRPVTGFRAAGEAGNRPPAAQLEPNGIRRPCFQLQSVDSHVAERAGKSA